MELRTDGSENPFVKPKTPCKILGNEVDKTPGIKSAIAFGREPTREEIPVRKSEEINPCTNLSGKSSINLLILLIGSDRDSAIESGKAVIDFIILLSNSVSLLESIPGLDEPPGLGVGFGSIVEAETTSIVGEIAVPFLKSRALDIRPAPNKKTPNASASFLLILYLFLSLLLSSGLPLFPPWITTNFAKISCDCSSFLALVPST